MHFLAEYRMDDYSHMMESEQPADQAYQSQMMANVNSDIDNANITTEPHESCASDEQKEQHLDEGQSISDNGDEIANAKNDSTESMEQTNDKCVTDSNNTNETETDGKSNVTNDDTQIEQEENPPGNGNDANETVDDDTAPTTTKNNKKEDDIELNQCRICMSADNLLDIFRIGEKTSFRICDLIMKLAPAVKISERDYLPHSVCAKCVERIEAAYELRVQCEETDKYLRSKLKRSKKTRRAPSDYVVVDCVESSSDSDDDQKSDDEFQLSEESEESSESESDSSYDEKKKTVPNRRGAGTWKRGPPPKRTNPVTYQQPAKKSRASVVYIKAENSDDDNGRASKAAAAKQAAAKPVTNRFQFRCDICNRPCVSAEALAQHRRIHVEETCNICSMKFKQRSALLQHMERHKNAEPDRICHKCKRVFPTKIECQRHVVTAHPMIIACTKCKRQFPNRAQLDTHNCAAERKAPPESSTKKKTDVDTPASGRDLFKSVAPLTTTYWSDSFSD